MLYFYKVFGTYFTEDDFIKKTLKISTSCGADYYLKMGKCTPCLDGYYGPNCIQMCPYPKFGRRCLDGPCQCPKENCDTRTGCRRSNTFLTSTRSTVDRTEEQSFTSTKSNLHEETNQNMIEINGRGKTNRRLFADDFLSTVLITFVGTAISCFLLFSIGSQIKSRLLIKRSQNSYHTPELHVCTHRI